jgi:hypothetical protein
MIKMIKEKLPLVNEKDYPFLQKNENSTKNSDSN